MSNASNAPYDIARPTGVCAATGRELVPGEPVVVALIERDGAAPLERLDFSLDAWARGERDPGGGRVFAYWRTTQPSPNARPRTFIDDDALLELFHDSADDDSLHADDAERRARSAFRFVLALILCRKRLLRHESSERGAMLVRERGAPPEAPPIRVEDPGMDAHALARATERLRAVLRGDE